MSWWVDDRDSFLPLRDIVLSATRRVLEPGVAVRFIFEMFSAFVELMTNTKAPLASVLWFETTQGFLFGSHSISAPTEALPMPTFPWKRAKSPSLPCKWSLGRPLVMDVSWAETSETKLGKPYQSKLPCLAGVNTLVGNFKMPSCSLSLIRDPGASCQSLLDTTYPSLEAPRRLN